MECDGHKLTGQVVRSEGPNLSGKHMTYRLLSLIIVQCTSMGVLHAGKLKIVWKLNTAAKF